MNQYNKTFYIFRHALATHSKHGYGKGRFTTGILPEGVPATERMATHLKKVGESANISSEVIRCRETSEIIARIAGKEFTFDKRLNESGFTETIDGVRERAQDFLNDVCHFPQSDILICSHGKIVAALKNLLIHDKFVTKDLYDYPLTGELLVIKDGKIKTLNFNSV